MESESAAQQRTCETIGAYAPGRYEEQVWEVITPSKTTEQSPRAGTAFAAQEFEKVGEGKTVVDPMFSDFTTGGSESSNEPNDSGKAIRQAEIVEACMPLAAESEATQCRADGAPEAHERELEPSEDPALYNVAHEESPGKTALSVASQESALMAAMEEAYNRGAADARAEFEQADKQREQKFVQVIEDLQAQCKEIAQNHERQAVELAFQVARRMIGEVVENQRDYVLDIINQAIAAAEGAEITSIRMSPQDFEFLTLEGVRERIKTHGERTIEFRRDETIKAGCIVTTAAGEIDFDLDRAWARLRNKAEQGAS